MRERNFTEVRKDPVLEGIVKVTVYEISYERHQPWISGGYDSGGNILRHRDGEVLMPKNYYEHSPEAVNRDICAELAGNALSKRYPNLYALAVSEARIDLDSKRQEKGHPEKVTGVLDLYVTCRFTLDSSGEKPKGPAAPK